MRLPFVMSLNNVFVYDWLFLRSQSSHAVEDARTRNATDTLNLLLTNYDKRLRPKFGGKPNNFYLFVRLAVHPLHAPTSDTRYRRNFPHLTVEI